MEKLGAVKLVYTKMKQPNHMLTYTGSSFPTDIWLPATFGIPPGEAIQYSVSNSKGVELLLQKKEGKNTGSVS